MRTISFQLVGHLRRAFALDWYGIHGAPHWARVRVNGLRLAAATGADPTVVELFAFLHDARRHHDGGDRRHGERAAHLAAELNGRFFHLDAGALDLLQWACRDHSAGYLDGDITVQTCWDADRLDLGRIGVRPDPARLCTARAREADFLAAAYRRSRAGR